LKLTGNELRVIVISGLLSDTQLTVKETFSIVIVSRFKVLITSVPILFVLVKGHVRPEKEDYWEVTAKRKFVRLFGLILPLITTTTRYLRRATRRKDTRTSARCSRKRGADCSSSSDRGAEGFRGRSGRANCGRSCGRSRKRSRGRVIDAEGD
jgi:hypothetical protein